MSDGHRTSSIPRPRDETRSRTATTTIQRNDLTTPIPRERQLVKGRGKRSLIVLGATMVTAALIAALFVLPVKAWLHQRDDINVKQEQLDVLAAANAELSAEVGRLGTADGVREAAREEIGYVDRKEIRLTVMPTPNAPVTLPGGWPYDVIGQIVEVRTTPPPAATPEPTPEIAP